MSQNQNLMPVGMVMSNQIGTPMLVNVAGGYMSQGSNIPTIGQMVPIQQQPLQQQVILIITL